MHFEENMKLWKCFLFSISFLFSQSNQQREVDKLTLIVSQKREIVKLKAKQRTGNITSMFINAFPFLNSLRYANQRIWPGPPIFVRISANFRKSVFTTHLVLGPKKRYNCELWAANLFFCTSDIFLLRFPRRNGTKLQKVHFPRPRSCPDFDRA